MPVTIRNVSGIDTSSRKFHIDWYVQIGLGECKNKINAGFKTTNLCNNKQQSNTSPHNNRSVSIPVIQSPCLSTPVCTQSSLVFVERSVKKSLAFQRPNGHNRFDTNR